MSRILFQVAFLSKLLQKQGQERKIEVNRIKPRVPEPGASSSTLRYSCITFHWLEPEENIISKPQETIIL